MNSQTWLRAVPPTIRAGPRLRAGFTDVPVIGIPTRCTTASPSPMAMAAVAGFAVAEVTRPHGIRTVVSLNSLMVDGTGMCGGCRIITSGGAKFACVDGPEFDAHTVDFDVLVQRNRTYAEREAQELREFTAHAEECVREVREACRLEAAHPEVRGHR